MKIVVITEDIENAVILAKGQHLGDIDMNQCVYKCLSVSHSWRQAANHCSSQIMDIVESADPYCVKPGFVVTVAEAKKIKFQCLWKPSFVIPTIESISSQFKRWRRKDREDPTKGDGSAEIHQLFCRLNRDDSQCVLIEQYRTVSSEYSKDHTFIAGFHTDALTDMMDENNHDGILFVDSTYKTYRQRMRMVHTLFVIKTVDGNTVYS